VQTKKPVTSVAGFFVCEFVIDVDATPGFGVHLKFVSLGIALVPALLTPKATSNCVLASDPRQ
jgi:hypothetical protein